MKRKLNFSPACNQALRIGKRGSYFHRNPQDEIGAQYAYSGLDRVGNPEAIPYPFLPTRLSPPHIRLRDRWHSPLSLVGVEDPIDLPRRKTIRGDCAESFHGARRTCLRLQKADGLLPGGGSAQQLSPCGRNARMEGAGFPGGEPLYLAERRFDRGHQ